MNAAIHRGYTGYCMVGIDASFLPYCSQSCGARSEVIPVGAVYGYCEVDVTISPMEDVVVVFSS